MQRKTRRILTRLIALFILLSSVTGLLSAQSTYAELEKQAIKPDEQGAWFKKSF